MTKVIRNWTAKRAGGRITINGMDEGGAPLKVVGVDYIKPDGPVQAPYIVAVDKDGNRWRLAA